MNFGDSKSVNKWNFAREWWFLELPLFLKEPYSFPCWFFLLTLQMRVCVGAIFLFSFLFLVATLQIISMNIQFPFKHFIIKHIFYSRLFHVFICLHGSIPFISTWSVWLLFNKSCCFFGDVVVFSVCDLRTWWAIKIIHSN